MAIFFWKTQNVQTLNFLLVKHIDKDISDVKILITKEHPSRAVELAISFLKIALKYQFLKPILAIKC